MSPFRVLYINIISFNHNESSTKKSENKIRNFKASTSLSVKGVPDPAIKKLEGHYHYRSKTVPGVSASFGIIIRERVERLYAHFKNLMIIVRVTLFKHWKMGLLSL